MLYMGGFNDLDKYALEDLQELESIGSSSGVNIVAQLDYAKEKGRANRYYITQNSNPENGFNSPVAGETQSDPNMGDPDELLNFISFCAREYPAERYVLVFWGHGLGVFDDEKSDTGRSHTVTYIDSPVPYDLSNFIKKKPEKAIFHGSKFVVLDPELGDSLTDREIGEASDDIIGVLGKKVEITLFDACYMATTEITRQARLFANYMVASEYVVPYRGMPYGVAGIIELLNKSLSADGAEIARGMTELFMNFYQAEMSDDKTRATTSSIDLEKTKKLHIALSKASESFLEYMKASPFCAVAEFQRAREESQPKFGVSSKRDPGDDVVDLFAFMKSIAKTVRNDKCIESAEKVYTLKDSVILSEGHGGKNFTGSDFIHGLTLYFPAFSGDIDNPILDHKCKFPFQYEVNNPDWYRFVRQFQFPVPTVQFDFSNASPFFDGGKFAVSNTQFELIVNGLESSVAGVSITNIGIYVKSRLSDCFIDIKFGITHDGEFEKIAEYQACKSGRIEKIELDIVPRKGMSFVAKVKYRDEEFEVFNVPIRVVFKNNNILLIHKERLEGDYWGMDKMPLGYLKMLPCEWIKLYSGKMVVRSLPKLKPEYKLSDPELKTYLLMLEKKSHLVFVGRDFLYDLEKSPLPSAKKILKRCDGISWEEPKFENMDHVNLQCSANSKIKFDLPVLELKTDQLDYCDIFNFPEEGFVPLLEFSEVGICAVLQPIGDGSIVWIGLNLKTFPQNWITQFFNSLLTYFQTN